MKWLFSLFRWLFYPSFLTKLDNYLLEHHPLIWQSNSHKITYWNFLLFLPVIPVVYSLPIGYYLYQNPNWSIFLISHLIFYLIVYVFIYRLSSAIDLDIYKLSDFTKIYLLNFWNLFLFNLVLFSFFYFLLYRMTTIIPPSQLFSEWQKVGSDVAKMEYYATIAHFQELARKDLFYLFIQPGSFQKFLKWQLDAVVFVLPAITSFLVAIQTGILKLKEKKDTIIAGIFYLFYLFLLYLGGDLYVILVWPINVLLFILIPVVFKKQNKWLKLFLVFLHITLFYNIILSLFVLLRFKDNVDFIYYLLFYLLGIVLSIFYLKLIALKQNAYREGKNS